MPADAMNTDSGMRRRVASTIGATGIVFGDIGTSPLYAFKECFAVTHGHAINLPNVLGILSLILWALILIVSGKYILFILRADYKGEGGILSLIAQIFANPATQHGKHLIAIFTVLGIFGAALLYGDGMITPAISVLSAVEGLEYASPALEPYVLPIAVVILVLLFVFQHRGTGKLGIVFGPIMLVWFFALAAIGLWQICARPEVLLAFSPHYGVHFLLTHGVEGALVLGSVFLVVTGAEALYADLGHFGRTPIRLAWQTVVFPALALNYLGQGALILGNPDPQAVANPFYAAVPGWALYPMVGLATLATVIASQALIAGAFSLTLQAIQLGFCPRLRVQHTSAAEYGQIYIPQVNWGLMIACIALVLGFKSSDNLASAYGVAVSLTMLLTTVLFAYLVLKIWKWKLWQAILICGTFLAIESVFFTANSFKIPHGGWFGLLAAALVFVLMMTWKRGRRLLYKRLKPTLLPLDIFLKEVEKTSVPRVKGCAVFLSATSGITPLALLHNLKHNKILHETVVLLTIHIEAKAVVAPEDRLSAGELGHGFHRAFANYGFMENPDVPALIDRLIALGVPVDPNDVTYFLSRETPVPGAVCRMAPWRRALFNFMSRNATSPARFFNLPPGRVVELGMQVEF